MMVFCGFVSTRNFVLFLLVTALVSVVSPTPVGAGPDPQDVMISMSDVAGASPGATGLVAIKSDPISTDDLRIMVSGLAPSTTHAVFLAAARDTGALPVQFLGEFTTGPRGRAFFSATAEMVNAYASANPGATQADGTAPRLSGAFARGGFNVPLDFIRIYQAIAMPGGAQTVFSQDAASPGGIHVLSTDTRIPDEMPSAQFLYNIVALHSMKCMGVESNDVQDGLQIRQQTCAGPSQRNQLFRFVPTGRGTFEIRPQNSLSCLEIQNASQDPVAPATQVRCRGIGAPQQQFRVVQMGPPGYFNLMPMHSGQCLDVSRVSQDDGAPIIQFMCAGARKTNQQFRITRMDAM